MAPISFHTQGVTVTPAEENMRLWNVVIAGPVRVSVLVRPCGRGLTGEWRWVG